jgi:catalase-peroxidase
MGPKARYVGDLVPEEDLLWQDPLPAADYKMIDQDDEEKLQNMILDSGLSNANWYARPGRRPPASAARTCVAGPTAAACASRRRRTGRSITPMNWRGFSRCSRASRRTSTRPMFRRTKVSMADLIVLGGCAGEEARPEAGARGRGAVRARSHDATPEMTDADAFAVLEPKSDGFRNYLGREHRPVPAEECCSIKRPTAHAHRSGDDRFGRGMRVLGANERGPSPARRFHGSAPAP